MTRLDGLRMPLLSRFIGLLGDSHRQPDHETRPRAWLALNLDLAAMALNNTERDSQAKTGALLTFGRKEWLKDPHADIRWHAQARIAHLKDDIASAIAAELVVVGRDRQLAAFRHRVDRIDDQVG